MPFCPKCKYEYREGFTLCPDCDVELVPELPWRKNHLSRSISNWS